MVKVIIDTDIGDDIDDALALALASRSPELEILAVTTVYGKVKLRAKLAAKILRAFGKGDIPIAIGASKPLLNPEPTHTPNQALALDPSDNFPNISKKHAVDLIIDMLREEKEVNLITLGPLTNIALALLKDREAFRKAKLIIMGGCIGRNVAEYNIKSDPEAAHIVLTSGLPITLVGLDVTLRCVMTDDMLQILEKSKDPSLIVLRRYLKLWASITKEKPIMHDPLTMAVSFNPRLVVKKLMHIEVELKGEYTRGFTICLEGKQPNAEVCIDVNVQEFMNLYGNRVLIK